MNHRNPALKPSFLSSSGVLVFSLALFLMPVVCVLAATAEPAGSEVLEPLDDLDEPPKVEVPKSSPSYDKLMKLFQAHNYEGVGLQYEEEATLNFLYRIFSNPKTWKRQAKSIYTGLQMSYDSKAKSLTIGGTTDANMVLTYIQKNVPLIPPPQK